MLNLLWLLLPLAACSGWYVARREYRKKSEHQQHQFPLDYLKGVNYLLNEQPDKAIDVFVGMLQLDNETVEIHLALGNLFRRRGEVDRAIRIHQNLITRDHLNAGHRLMALIELAQDYIGAGLLDRAESLCLEIVDLDAKNVQAMGMLLDVYQQEKEWFRAIEIARKIEDSTGESFTATIAQFYCELADAARQDGDTAQTRRMLNRALEQDENCARAIILQGNLACEAGQTEIAMAAYQQLAERAPQYLTEVLPAMTRCYDAAGKSRELLEYLRSLLDSHHEIDLVLTVARLLEDQQGLDAAMEFLSIQTVRHPSIRGAEYLVSLAQRIDEPCSARLRPINTLLSKILEKKPTYRCNNCGFDAVAMHWCCPGCRRWSSVLPIQEFRWGASI